jgi:hypothetical protein
VTQTNFTALSKTPSSTVTLSWKRKLVIAGLLCLEIPFGIVFFPMAAVLVLTGILAPLAIMVFKVATMPLTLSMKYKSAWQSEGHLDSGGKAE